MNILVIEDDDYKFKNICEYLNILNNKTQIFRAKTQNEAFRSIMKNNYEYIFLDMNFPDLEGSHIKKDNGLSFLEITKGVDKYNELIKNSKIIICSSNKKANYEEKLKNHKNVIGYIEYNSSVYLLNDFKTLLN